LGYVILGIVALMSIVGIVVYSYGGSASRVEAVRSKGASEEEIQRGLALFRQLRNLFWYALVISVLGAILLAVSK